MFKAALTAASLAFALTAAPVTAIASEVITHGNFKLQGLYEKGQWFVGSTYDTTDGAQWCTITSTNRRGQDFDIDGHSDGSMAVYVYDKRWTMDEGEVDAVIDLDGEVWHVTLHTQDDHMYAYFEKTDVRKTFLTDYRSAADITVTADGQLVGEFSLKNSDKALPKFVNCWAEIGRKA